MRSSNSQNFRLIDLLVVTSLDIPSCSSVEISSPLTLAAQKLNTLNIKAVKLRRLQNSHSMFSMSVGL